MISICSWVFDPAGVLYIEREGPNCTGLEESRRRVTVTRTLDGGASAYDTGYSAADRDLTIQLQNATIAQIETAGRLVELYQTVTVALRDGVFKAVPQRRYRSGVDLYLSLQCLERLS